MRKFHLVVVLAVAALAAPTWAKDEPAEATVICKDGSTSKGGRGACRGHGGVDKKATEAAAPKKETKKETKKEKDESKKEATVPSAPAAEATVTCKDGTTSKGGRGACRGHGGVDKKAGKPSEESGGTVSSTRSAARPTGATEETVVCKDGTTSKGGRGACRGHGGVDKEASKAGAKGAAAAGAAAAAPPAAAPPAAVTPPPAAARPAAAPPAPAAQGETSARTTRKNTDPTGATAKCKDGTYSHAKHHTGACSNHGGVAEWLDQPAK